MKLRTHMTFNNNSTMQLLQNVFTILILVTLGYCNNQTQNDPQIEYICPPIFIRLGQSCYYFSRQMATWHDAHFSCRDKGGQLMALESQWEDNTVRTFLSRPEFARLNRWIGGIFNWSRQQWTWGSTATVMPYEGFAIQRVPPSFHWFCVFMSPTLSYQWDYNLCTASMHYICEMPQSRIIVTDINV